MCVPNMLLLSVCVDPHPLPLEILNTGSVDAVKGMIVIWGKSRTILLSGANPGISNGGGGGRAKKIIHA